MGAVLNGFMATWSAARDTFGEGTPPGGDQFDESPRLRRVQSDVQAATSGSQWSGAGADVYDAANRQQGRVLAATADLDQKLRLEVDRAAAVVAAGRRDLDSVRQWVVTAASNLPKTPHGDRALYTIVRRGSGDVADILQKSNGDLSSIAARVRVIDADYRTLQVE